MLMERVIIIMKSSRIRNRLLSSLLAISILFSLAIQPVFATEPVADEQDITAQLIDQIIAEYGDNIKEFNEIVSFTLDETLVPDEDGYVTFIVSQDELANYASPRSNLTYYNAPTIYGKYNGPMMNFTGNRLSYAFKFTNVNGGAIPGGAVSTEVYPLYIATPIDVLNADTDGVIHTSAGRVIVPNATYNYICRAYTNGVPVKASMSFVSHTI